MDCDKLIPRDVALTEDGTLILSFYLNAEYAAMDHPPSEAYVRTVVRASDVAMLGLTDRGRAD